MAHSYHILLKRDFKLTDYNLIDDLILWKNAKQYHENWKNRCSNCLAPCCFLSMTGYTYNYQTDNKTEDEIEDNQSFWRHGFVIERIKNMDIIEQTQEWGFTLPLAQSDELNRKGGLQICPLNIDSKCLIYENRPKMCRTWKCRMKTVSGNKLD